MATTCPSCASQGLIPAAPAYPGCPPSVPAQGCPAVWGAITGSLGNQADLVAALATASGAATWGAITGTVASQVDLVAYINLVAALKGGANVFTGTNIFQDVVQFDFPDIYLDAGAFLVGSRGTGLQSTGVGEASMPSSSGTGNTGVGYQSLQNITNSGLNTAVGHRALGAQTSGNGNTAVGASAGLAILGGVSNTAIGQGAGPATGALSNTTCVGASSVATKANQAIFANDLTTETVLHGNLVAHSKTITAIGTTGAQTINKTCGSVVFAGAATSLVVTNSFAVAPTSGATGSIIICQLRTADATAVLGSAVCAADGSFTIHMTTAPTGATRVDFLLFN